MKAKAIKQITKSKSKSQALKAKSPAKPVKSPKAKTAPKPVKAKNMKTAEKSGSQKQSAKVKYQNQSVKVSKLGIIAGSGSLPQKAVNEAILKNLEYEVYSLSEEAVSPLYDKNGRKIKAAQVYLARFNEILRQIKKDGITHLIIAGKVHKKTFLKGIRFNMQTLKLLKKIRDNNDKSIFELIVTEFEGIGVNVLHQDKFLKSLFLSPGIYSRLKPSAEQNADIRFGMDFARKIAALDIGQSVVVSDKTLLAVEAAEGTDAAIERGAEFSRSGSAVVCKVMRKNQDTRLDVPTVGLKTLEVMKRCGCKVLAIDAGHTFVIDKDEFIKKINDYKMIFVSV